MMLRSNLRLTRAVLRCGAAAVLATAAPAIAQQPAAPQTAPPSDNAVVNLVRLLVEEGVLKPEKAEALIRQAEAEAAQTRAAAPAASELAELPPPPAGTRRVPYVPETVRAQIKDELRAEVLAQAKSEGWASPGEATPAWVRNIRLYGDLRVRSQSNFYADMNAPFVDVREFNATGPYDIEFEGFPILNTTLDRKNLVQLRARLGVEANVADRFKVGVQLATGDDPSPVSTNSLLGGGFAKRDVWLQLAYLRGEVVPGVSAVVGRFDNPFRHTDLLFDPDLAFDGVAGEANIGRLLGGDYTVALRGGAFPLDFGDVDLPSRSLFKRNFRDRYLLSGQLELGKRFEGGFDVRLAGAYHNFTYLRGRVSEPCDIYSDPNIQCSTDQQVFPFTSKGNTYFFLRQINETRNPLPGNPRSPQLLGLKFAYRVLDVNGSVSVPVTDAIRATLTGNYVHNFGFDPQNICREGVLGAPQTNIIIVDEPPPPPDPDNPNAQPADPNVCDGTGRAVFLGGNEGYGAMLSIGSAPRSDVDPRGIRKGAWTLFGGYKYLESDAVLDGFTDSDFHLGGTNAKGYFVGGRYGLFDNIRIGARWLSANEIVGEPLAIDVLQIDLEAAF